MAFLYGDATLSSLGSNFIAFLPDALDFAVKLLQADERIEAGGGQARTLEHAAEAEIEKLEALGETIALAAAPSRIASETATGQCAERIARTVADVVRAEIDRVQKELSGERIRIDAQAAEARAGCVQALEALLVKHDLPDMTGELRLQHQGGGRYQARLHVRTEWGIDAELELDVPPTHALAHVLRVDKIVERLEVQAPESGGWLRKEVKLRPQRLDKDYVTELILGAEEATLRLRTATDGSGVGFDVSVRGGPANVRVVRIGEGDLPPFELAEVDAERVAALKDKLAALCDELKGHRRALLEARFGETSLRTLASPRVVVEKMVAAIAPIVQEIDKRSLGQTELVLKRLLSDGRREEIFVAKEQLLQRLEPLAPSLRELFAPLGLFREGAPQPTPKAPEPPKALEPPKAPELPKAPMKSRPPTLEVMPEDVSEATPPPEEPSVTLDPAKS